MNNKILLPIFIVVVVLAGGLLLLNSGGNLINNNSSNQINNNQATSPTPTKGQTTQTAVNVTSVGFEPVTITISAGSQVAWTNRSGAEVTVSSDVHPTHLLYPFLNLGNFTDGSSVSVTFDKPGTYTYHNHFNPTQKGTVIVK